MTANHQFFEPSEELHFSSSSANQHSHAAQARKGALWAFCVTPGNPWMFVMRPIIHSICSVSAKSPHCSPTIELWGAFNPSALRGGRSLFCDIMHSANTLNESPLTHCTDSSISKSTDYKGVGTDTRCLFWIGMKAFPERFSYFFPCFDFKRLM